MLVYMYACYMKLSCQLILSTRQMFLLLQNLIYLPVESLCRLVGNNDHNYNIDIFRIGTFTAIILLFKISDNSRDKFRELVLPFKNIAEKSI